MPGERAPDWVSSFSTSVMTAEASAGWLAMSFWLNGLALSLVNGYAGAATTNPAAAIFAVTP